MTVLDRTFDRIDESLESYRATLFSLLRQPSISATGEGIDACVDLVESIADRYGFRTDRIETSANPLVYGETIVDEAAPTICFYGHYDVQPPGDEDAWASPPFEPTVRDGAVYARGSGDNKGQLAAHLFAADAIRRTTGALPANVKLLFEGNEETGSAGLVEYLDRGPDRLADIDLVYVADGPMHASRRPTLAYGNRGLLSVDLHVTEAAEDVHSGHFGGPVPNAAWTLVELLSNMRGDDGIEIEGFDDAVSIPEAARDRCRSIPLDLEAVAAELGLPALDVGTAAAYLEAATLEPTLTINGLRCGYTGEGMKTVIPHRASAKLDVRLVPSQDPDRIFRRLVDHLDRRHPRVRVDRLGSFPPMLTPLDTPMAEPVRTALSAVWDGPVVEIPMVGGSLPTAAFPAAVDAPVLIVPYANPDQANHAPNEHLDLDCFANGIKTSAAVIDGLASTSWN